MPPAPPPPAKPSAQHARFFFLIGPLRTGSSLMARCIDDHPDAICLCESEINRALFPPHYISLHVKRMMDHGLTLEEVTKLLDRKPHGSLQAFVRWHADALALLRHRLGKPHVTLIGDKSPDYFAAPTIVAQMAKGPVPLIYTVRDPRAILRSIWRQDQSEAQKQERWRFLKENVRTWTPHLDAAQNAQHTARQNGGVVAVGGTAAGGAGPNILISRYEDLIHQPDATMARVYAHLGLAPSTRYREPFERLHHRRFLWTTSVDWATGAAKAFNPARAAISDADLTPEQLAMVYDDADVQAFMARFGYG